MPERGNGAAADPLLYQALTGSEHEWFDHCRKVADGNLRVAARHFDQDGAELRSLREFGVHWLTEGRRSEDSYESSAAAAIGTLAMALADAAPAADAAERLVAHVRQANLVSIGARPPRTGTERSAGWSIVQLIGEADPAAAGFGELVVQTLLSAEPLVVRSKVTVPVLFGGGEIRAETYGRTDRGVAGKLVLQRLKSGPPGLHPHPVTMAFLHASEDFVASLENAWATSSLSRGDACVTWSLLLDNAAGDPVNKVKGGSLGGAFAVGLDELARRSGTLGAFVHRRLLDPACVVSATVDESGRLGEVSSLDDKIAAAGRAEVRRLVVAPASFGPATDAVRAGTDLAVQQAATVRSAVAAVRRSRNPRFRWTAAVAAVVALALAGVGLVGYNGHVGSLAASLAAQAVTLANRNPRLAAIYALASDTLRPTAESRDAKFTVAANNRYAVASASVSAEPIRSVASDDQTVLVSDGSKDVTVLTYPELQAVGRIAMAAPNAQLAYRGTNQEFVAVDDGALKFYAGEAGKVPLLVQTVELGLETRFMSTEDIFGPYVDREGGVLVLSQSMKGAYWSPATHQTFRFDLKEYQRVEQQYGDDSLVAASGFAPNRGESDPGEPTNAATDELFYVATSRGDVLQLHLSEAGFTDSGTGRPPQAWVDQWFRNSRGAHVTALGWLGESLLVGTDAGLSKWDDAASYRGDESAFPFAGVASRVETIASIPSYTEQSEAAILTTRGVELVSSDHSSALNGVTAASSSDMPVTSITTTGTGAWVAGRSNGTITLIDPGYRPFASGGMFTNASAYGVAADGSVLLSTGQQQFADGVARYAIEFDQEQKEYELEQIAAYPIDDGAFPTGPFLNAVAGDGQVVVAAGKRHPMTAPGVVLVWKQPDEPPLVLDFAADEVTEGLDMVTAVAYAPRLRSVAGFNLLQGAVAIWSVDSGERLGTVQLRANPDGDNVDGRTRMTASANGEVLAVAMENQVAVIEVESASVRSTFSVGNGWGLISPDGRRLALATDDKLTITDLAGNQQGVIHTPGYDQAEWSPDGTILAVSDQATRQISFFDTGTYRQIGLPWSNPSGLLPVMLRWNGDGTKLLVTNGAEGTDGNSVLQAKGVDILEPTTNTFERQLCALIGGEVTAEEWRDAGGVLVPLPGLCPPPAEDAADSPTPSAMPAETTSTARSTDLIDDDLAFALVPSDGIHHAGKLYFGRLPLEPVYNGFVSLARPGIVSSIAGDQEAVLAVFDHSAGGVGWPQFLVLYGKDLTILGSFDLSDAVAAEHVDLVGTEPVEGGVKLRLDSYEGAGFEVREWSGTLRYDDGRLGLHDLTQLSGPPYQTER